MTSQQPGWSFVSGRWRTRRPHYDVTRQWTPAQHATIHNRDSDNKATWVRRRSEVQKKYGCWQRPLRWGQVPMKMLQLRMRLTDTNPFDSLSVPNRPPKAKTSAFDLDSSLKLAEVITLDQSRRQSRRISVSPITHRASFDHLDRADSSY